MLRIYNSLTRKIEEFRPINPPDVGFYSCGPTVYDFVHIGNFRIYATADFLLRTLKFFGYKPRYIMNITDVGHLTGDNLGDASIGEDRMEKASKREGKSAWDIAKFYEKQFLEDYGKLNLTIPEKFTRATDYISEQIELVKRLEKKGYTYKTSDGVYFDTSKFPDYGKLSTLDARGIDPGIRVKIGEKKNPRDFALWKFSPSAKSGQTKRQMEWDSPWGMGFPGWHIECSAMSMKFLGESFDIHAGGEDLRSTHHPNEIAQSEAATGRQFVKYWIHGAFMNIGGARMSKSLGNLYTLSDLVKKDYSPQALRYLYMTIHYRQRVNFTFEALSAAQKSYESMQSQVNELRESRERNQLSAEKLIKTDEYRKKFIEAIGNDLNLPQALAVGWEVLKSNIPAADKYDLIIMFNDVFGLKFAPVKLDIPREINDLASQRFTLRSEGKFRQADAIRNKIKSKGYDVADIKDGFEIIKPT